MRTSTRVLRVNVTQSDGVEGSLSLHRIFPAPSVDRRAPARACTTRPLLSRLDAALDSTRTPKSAGSRTLVRLAGTRRLRAGPDSRQQVGQHRPADHVDGVAAFAAVARSVLFVMTDPRTIGRLLGAPKNNWAHRPPDARLPDRRRESRRDAEGSLDQQDRMARETDQTIREAIVSATRTQGPDRQTRSDALARGLPDDAGRVR